MSLFELVVEFIDKVLPVLLADDQVDNTDYAKLYADLKKYALKIAKLPFFSKHCRYWPWLPDDENGKPKAKAKVAPPAKGKGRRRPPTKIN
jgi:hypothetical protein